MILAATVQVPLCLSESCRAPLDSPVAAFLFVWFHI